MNLTKENCKLEINVILEGEYAGTELLEASVKGHDDPLFIAVPGSSPDNELSVEEKVEWFTANPEWRGSARVAESKTGSYYIKISNRKTSKVLDL